MTRRPLAIVRTVPNAFADALAADRPSGGFDVDAARRQHAQYRRALEAGGFVVEEVPGDEAHPDSPFVEDVAVVVGGRALATRPGHESRQGEVGPVAAVLARYLAVEEMVGDARMDGGDVLAVGRLLFVGRGVRTNDAGIEALSRFVSPGVVVVPVDVWGVLHLKTAVSALDEHTVLAHPGVFDIARFGDLEVVLADGDDPGAANVVRLPDGSILVGAHHHKTARLLAKRGLRTVPVDTSEFARADGGLSCLSLRLRSVLVPGPLYSRSTSEGT